MSASEGGVETYTADIGDTGDNWRLGGAKQGVSAEDKKKKSVKYGFDDDESDAISEKGKDAVMEVGDAPGESTADLESELDTPKFDFAYNVQTKNIVFNAKDFWKSHAVHVSPETADALYNWYLRFEEQVHKGEHRNLPFTKMSEAHANEIFRRTDIISASCLFLGSERLVDLDEATGQSSIGGIEGYYVAVPWRNLDESYLPHLKAMTMEEGNALVEHLYNWPVFVRKRNIPSLDDPSMLHANALYHLDGGAPFFTDKVYAYQHAPAIFVAWKEDSSINTDAYRTERDRLTAHMIGGSVLVAAETPDPVRDPPAPIQDPIPIQKGIDTLMEETQGEAVSQSSSEEEEEKPKRKKHKKKKRKKKRAEARGEVDPIESFSSEEG